MQDKNLIDSAKPVSISITFIFAVDKRINIKIIIHKK